MNFRIQISFIFSLLFIIQTTAQSSLRAGLPRIYKQIGPTYRLSPTFPTGPYLPTLPKGPVNDPPKPTNNRPEKRTIHFVHGLSGSESSWGNAAAAVDIKYRVEAETPSWEDYQTLPLQSASNRLEQDLTEHRDTDPSRSFVIAHSMGGLAAREIDRQYTAGKVRDAERKFHGLVTVTTPHGGAQIVNSLTSSQDFLRYACDAITAVKFEELFEDNFRLRWIISATGVDAKVEAVSETLCGPVLENAFDFLVAGKFINRSAQDIKVGSPFMNRLSRHKTTIPSVNVISSEDTPAFWKLATNFMNAPNDDLPFQARADSDLEKFALQNERKYMAKRDHHVKRREYYKRAWYAFGARSKKKAHDKAHLAYAKGVRFFRFGNRSWLATIGAVTNEKIVDYYQCNCSDGRVFDTDAVYRCASQRGCRATAVVNEIRTHIEPSDGVVRESAQGVWRAENTYHIDNNNHLQVRNSPEMGDFLEKYLLKGVDVNDFFKTSLRQ